MSEPVGNSPRGEIPGNSHKSREAAPAVEPREKIEKVITGKVVRRKPPFYKRIARSMVADDVENVGEFVVTDVLIPAIKNLMFDIITKGSARTLYGSGGSASRTHTSSSGVSTIKRSNYSGMSNSEPSGRSLDRESRALHNFDPIELETRDQAVLAIEELRVLIGRFNRASVADLYDLLGVSSGFPDRQWGWTNLDEAGVRQVRGGWLLNLPRPELLR